MTDSIDHPAARRSDGGLLQPEQLLEHVDWVRHLAARLVRDEHGAEDLAQRTLMTALRRPPHIARGSLRGWLTRVLKNEASSERRDRGRRHGREETVARDRGQVTDDPAEIERRFGLHRSLVAAVDRLEGPQRTVIVLRYFEELSPREIAEHLGEPIRTIETRLHRGRERLRQLLDSEYGARGSWSVLALPAALDGGAGAGVLTSSSPVSTLPVASPLAAGLALMSTKTILMAGACVGALLLGVRLIPVGDVPRNVEVAVTGDRRLPDHVVPPRDVSPALVAPVGNAQGSAREAAEFEGAADTPEPAGAFPADTPMCTVRGIVLDVEGEPLAGVQVRLEGYKGWRNGVDVPALDGRLPMFGFQTRTDAVGVFSIDAPVPTIPAAMLKILPGPFHDSERRIFGTGTRMVPPLLAGLRDIGTLRLARTGAVSGHVTDSSGAPIEGVKIGIGPTANTTYGRDVWSDANGNYLVAHAPAGEYGVKARPERHMDAFSTPHVIEVGKTTGPVDFVLQDAPAISGVVLDDGGAPVENARLRGLPVGSGSHASARSGPDGRFTLYLPQDQPYRVSASRDGYVKWGEEHGETSTYRPGKDDLEVTLIRVDPITFVVVDAESGEPIERFGLRVLEDNGSEAHSRIYTERRRPQLGDHLGGTTQATARERIDLYVVSADGYLLGSGDVVQDDGGSRIQTVRLRRGRTVTGRVVQGGVPVAGASVEIVRGFDRARSDATKGELPEPDAARFRVQVNSKVVAQSAADGRFTLAGLGGGLHRLRLVSGAGAMADVFPLQVTSVAVDLGDIELVAAGSILGAVLVPDGIDPAGITVYLDDWRRGVTTATDTEGRFRFDGVSSGLHSVQTNERSGSIAGTDAVSVVVASGAESAVTIDALDRAMTSVELTVLVNGVPAAGIQIDVVSSDGERSEHKMLGRCDESGRVHGSARAWGEARVRAFFPGAMATVHPTARLLLVAGAPVEETIRFEFASVALRFPDSVRLPAIGTLNVVLTPRAGGDPVRLYIGLRDGVPSSDLEDLVKVQGQTLTAALVPPGRYSMVCELIDDTTEQKFTELGNGSVRIGRVPYFEGQATVDARLGETVTVDL